MLIEGYELYLESNSLLLVAFVFLLLILLSLLEWSGNKQMDTRIEQEPGEDEAEGENGQNQDNNALVSYNNRPPPSDTQTLIDRYMGKVNFNMRSEDLDKPWFHQGITRAMAQDMLKGKEQGSFLVRPSSQRGSYAMSWVKNQQSGEISHSLIHGLFPGFSLKQSPSLEERFWTLQSLVDNCPHLQKPIVAENYIANKSSFQRNIARTCSEVVGRIVEKLYANNPALTEIKWNICILGEGTELFTAHTREKRTFVRYCDEEYAAPELLPLSENGLGLVCQALHNNTTLRSLTITGHEGYMLLSFKPDLGDTEAALIGKMLQVNKTLTQLNLNVNGITDAGAKAIAQGLTFNRSLKRLNLSNNFIGSDGLSYFAELLKTNPVLEDCDVRNQLQHSGMTNFVALSCSENIKQSISMIEETLRRRAELVSSLGASIIPGTVSLSSPARSSFLSVFHGFLSKKKVERRLASHIPGSFLFYLNRFIPNVLFIGIVQDVPHSHGDAPQFQHELEAVVRAPHTPPKQVVPSLFEFCSWYISSKRIYLEHVDRLDDVVHDRYKAVQLLIGLWGVKYFASPQSSTPSLSSSAHASSSSSSSSHKSKSQSAVHHHYADQPEDKPHSSHRSSQSHSSRSSQSSHRSHSSHSSRSHSSRSHSSNSSPKPNTPNEPHYSILGSPAASPKPATDTPESPVSSLSDSANGTPSPSLSDSANGTPPLSSFADYAVNGTLPSPSLSSPDPFSTNPTPALNVTPPSSGTESDSNTDSDSNLPPSSSSRQNSNSNVPTNSQTSPKSRSSASQNNNNNINNNTNHHNNNHGNHTNHSHHTSHASTTTRGSPGAHGHSNSNVFPTIAFLVHKNKSWLKYPVQIPPQDPHSR